ncbi:MAG: TIGR01458 family HAD-type hydrolase [Chromatiales bacterium]
MQLPDPLKAVLIDLSGVLYVGDEALPGAVAALERLRAAKLTVRFLTNTTRSPRSAILKKLAQMGFAVDSEEIFTAPMATRKLLAQRGLRPHYLVHPDIESEMGPRDTDPNAVVMGDAGPYFTYDRLNQAFRLLMKGLPLIVMARNRYFKERDGLSLDMGAFVSALEYSAGVKAEVVGKPAKPYFDTVLRDVGTSAEEAVMIGDDLHDDIEGAQQAGIAGVLVRTGKYRPEDERDPSVCPALTVNDFPAAVDRLLKRL